VPGRLHVWAEDDDPNPCHAEKPRSGILTEDFRMQLRASW